MDCCLRGINTVTVCWVERWLLLPLLFSNVCVLFPCRYSPAEGSMKLASLLSASAAEPPFHYLSLLTRTDCGCQPTSPSTPPQSHPLPPPPPTPVLPAASREKTRTVPIPCCNLFYHCYPRRAKPTTNSRCIISSDGAPLDPATGSNPRQVRDVKWCQLNINPVDPMYMSKTCILSQGCVLWLCTIIHLPPPRCSSLY